MSILKFLTKNELKIPSLPKIALRVLEAVQDEKSSFDRLEKIISSDPALSARTLKLANSSFYGLKNKVRNLKGAISILGTNALKNIALSFMLSDILSNEPDNYSVFNLFWKKSISNAVGAEIIASLVNSRHDNCFFTGLFQDIGAITMHQCIPEKYKKVLEIEDMQDSIIESERHIFGFDHQEVGAEILKRWGLPKDIYEPIRYHHEGEKAPKRTNSSTDILFCADMVSSFYHDKPDPEKINRAKQFLCGGQGLPVETVNKAIDAIAVKSLEMISFFNIDTQSLKPYSQILQEANEELSKMNLSYDQLIMELNRSKEKIEQLNRELLLKNKKLKWLVIRDSLTELFNHKHFHEILGMEIKRARRYKTDLSLILFDIDNFKSINDTYGHQAGDHMLKNIAAIASKLARQTDTIYRYGGDEFAVILSQTNLEGAIIFAERVRSTIEKTNFQVNTNSLKTTVSMGVSTCDPLSENQHKDLLIKNADRALYLSKDAGRNRIKIFNRGAQWMRAITSNLD